MNTPEKFYHVSQSQLSIALHSRGCIFNGMQYVYNEADDTLIRKDIFDLDRKAQKQVKASEKKKWTTIKQIAEASQKSLEF